MFQEFAELKSLSWVTSRSRKLAIVAADVGSRVGIDDSLAIGAEDGPAGVEVSLLEGSVVDIPVDGKDGIGVGAADGPVGVKVGFVDGISRHHILNA